MRDESSPFRQRRLLIAHSRQRFGLTIHQMSEDMDVTTKTIRRNLDVSQSVGFGPEEAVGEYGRKTWRGKWDGNLPQFSRTLEEAIALAIGRRRLEPQAGTLFHEESQLAFQEVRASLPRLVLDYLDKFAVDGRNKKSNHINVGIIILLHVLSKKSEPSVWDQRIRPRCERCRIFAERDREPDAARGRGRRRGSSARHSREDPRPLRGKETL